MSITDHPPFAKANKAGIKTSILDWTYNPAPVKRVEVPKYSGGTRPMGIPTVPIV